jgi:hypothetical protein
MDVAISVCFPPHRDRTADLVGDLDRLRALVVRETTATA